MRWRDSGMLIKKVMNTFTADVVSVLGIIFAVSLVLIHLVQVNTTLPYLETAQITEPVNLHKQEYKIGEEVVGFFEGERYYDYPTIFNRTMVCDNFRAVLKPIRTESLPVGEINRDAVLLTLQDSIFLVPSQRVTPQTSCEIIYSPQTVRREYLLGGEELQNDQSYRTTDFDIVL